MVENLDGLIIDIINTKLGKVLHIYYNDNSKLFDLDTFNIYNEVYSISTHEKHYKKFANKNYLSFINISDEDAGISLDCIKTGEAINPNLYYNITLKNDNFNDDNWLQYNFSDENINLQKGDIVSFKGTNQNGFSYYNTEIDRRTILFKISTGLIKSVGSVMSLINENCIVNTIPCDYCFWKLFFGCKRLYIPPMLPATNLQNLCYYLMFYNCENLVYTPELPAKILKENCYELMFAYCYNLNCINKMCATLLSKGCYKGMFEYCTNLQKAPELPVETLVIRCYERMFESCTNLKKGPSILPALTIPNGYVSGKIYSPYSFMFYNCENLISAPELPATKLGGYCYYNMFNNCTNLISAPILPAETLAEGCYYSMFENCTNLISAPELPATKLLFDCYYSMFKNCTNLISAPILPAQTLVGNCYKSMFENCNNLSYIKCYATKNATNSTIDWVKNVAVKGTFEYTSKNIWDSITAPDSSIPNGWFSTNIKNLLTFKCINYKGSVYTDENLASISISHFGTNCTTTKPKLLYLKNNEGWTNWSEDVSIMLKANDKLCVIGNNLSGFSHSTKNYSSFVINGYFQVSGNVMTLVGNENIIEMPYCFYKLFYKADNNIKEHIISAPELPANALADNCYAYMFGNCTSLSCAPELPANALADNCYAYMFYNCTSLSCAPELPANALADSCYKGMFYNCLTLESIPILSANVLAENCYCEMFYNCYNLILPDEYKLPAEELKDSCYMSMFYGCKNITNAPAILATSFANECCKYMFYGCVNLELSPTLSIENFANECFYKMFGNTSAIIDCTTILFDEQSVQSGALKGLFADTILTYEMLCNIDTFPKRDNVPCLEAISENCYESMFEGCTKLETCPDLPDKGLASGCYKSMFKGSGIITCILPAEELVDSCYYEMFAYCENLTLITCRAKNNITENNATTYILLNAGQSYECIFIVPTEDEKAIWEGSGHIPDNWTIEIEN